MNILNKYCFGSQVYGTQTRHSDEDFICVVADIDKEESSMMSEANIQYLTVSEFQRRLDNHEIEMLECYFLPQRFILENQLPSFHFELDRGRLRVSISTTSADSWVKGKKKLLVEEKESKYLAIKSIFHAVRILGMGIQLASTGTIYNYSEYNWLHCELMIMAEQDTNLGLWAKIDDRYRKLFNKLNSEFKQLCPKINIAEHKLKADIIKLMMENGCYTDEVIKANLVSKLSELFRSY